MQQSSAPDTVNLTIDGIAVNVPKGTLVVEAAKTIKQEIPVYCYHTKLGPAGLCRVCLVEIEGMPKLQIGCNTPVSEGMVVRTQGEKVDAGRGIILELLLVNHPLDCPICDKGGECDLQDYAMAYARGNSDVADPKQSKPKGVDLGPTIVLDEERCVVCQRCVRFDDLIAGESQLVVKDRGHNDIIATATGDPYTHNFTGNVTELCPVGALTSKTYRFKSRPWDLQRTQTTCTHCSVGCQQFSDVRYGNVLRTMSVENDDTISDGWLCDRGRYNVGFYASNDRLTQPLYRHGDTFTQIGWDDAFMLWAKAIKEGAANGKSSAAIGGGRLLNEEAYLLAHVFRAIGVEDIDWRSGFQKQAAVAGHASYEELERAATIFVLGDAPHELAPVLWLRALKAVRASNAQIVRIAPRGPKPGGRYRDVASIDEARACAAADGTVAILWDGVDLEMGAQLYAAMHARNPLVYLFGEQANARGAEVMGVFPRNGRHAFATWKHAAAGNVAALSLFGVNPLRNAPNRETVGAALDATPFVVVSDLFMTETAQRATLVLPARGAFEKTGTTLALTGQLLPVNASLEAPAGTLSDLEMLVGLAQQFDLMLPTIEELDALVVRAAAEMPDAAPGDARYAMDDVRAERAIPTLWDGGGTSAHDDRVASMRDRAAAVPA